MLCTKTVLVRNCRCCSAALRPKGGATKIEAKNNNSSWSTFVLVDIANQGLGVILVYTLTSLETILYADKIQNDKTGQVWSSKFYKILCMSLQGPHILGVYLTYSTRVG